VRRLRRPLGRAVRHRRVRRPGHPGVRHRPETALIPVFDLDGTLVDSDEALANAFVRCGVPRESVTFGHVVADECARLGIAVDDYLAAYDSREVRAFPGVQEVVGRLDRWAVCSNKVRSAGLHELEALGWEPEVALFADDFGGPKRLPPVLRALGAGPAEVLFVGDTAHDRVVASEAGVRFALAAWNPRAEPRPGDLVLDRPADLLPLLGLGDR
jgi:HAD superfamily hydrolase (TIGR01549 family)